MKTPYRILIKRNKKNALHVRRKIRVKKTLNAGTAIRPRVSVFRSAKHIYVQAIDDASGKTLVAAGSVEKTLQKNIESKKPVEAAQEIGREFAVRLKKAGILQVVFDRSGFRYTGRVAALAQGARDAGLEF